ncbi:helix-turn-helix transcriptional regulator [Lacrimispora saccharolytica]|nr:helix-turn-helix transcriptional regulator [Lacrimispora saccharolytica]
MTQGERVREIRKTLNLTLEKFGDKLGIKKGAVSAIETNRNSLTDQTALLICREYNVNYDYLMNGEGEMFCDLPQTIIDELCMQYNLDDLDRALVELYIGLPERCRADIKSEIHKMIQKLGRWEVKYNKNDK